MIRRFFGALGNARLIELSRGVLNMLATSRERFQLLDHLPHYQVRSVNLFFLFVEPLWSAPGLGHKLLDFFCLHFLRPAVY